jgi:hypothetical protein
LPVVVASKTRYLGIVTPTDLNVETTVVEIGAQADDYLVEGYIDLSQLAAGDEVVVREYIAVDGVNYQLFCQATYSGPVPEPVIRFHTKTLLYGMMYKVTITQVARSSTHSGSSSLRTCSLIS